MVPHVRVRGSCTLRRSFVRLWSLLAGLQPSNDEGHADPLLHLKDIGFQPCFLYLGLAGEVLQVVESKAADPKLANDK